MTFDCRILTVCPCIKKQNKKPNKANYFLAWCHQTVSLRPN